MTLEASIERDLKNAVEGAGGLYLKLNPQGCVGVPDRLVLLPGGVARFVELKRPKGGRIAALQHWWQAQLVRLGFGHAFVRNRAEIDDFMASCGFGPGGETR